ncbi:MAG: GPW/gp25 family protein [Deltaproteobacteria bacterium]|nr:GPW/gp25 family protein [Deltaproteobacteria bacterium]
MGTLRSSFLSRLVGVASTDLSAQVATNLGHVLNTRKGCGSVIPELGLGDYEGAATTHDAVLVLVRELRALVVRYEPRLRDPEVTLRGRYGYRMVRFSLQGTVEGVVGKFHIDIDTSTRHVDVWPEDG